MATYCNKNLESGSPRKRKATGQWRVRGRKQKAGMRSENGGPVRKEFELLDTGCAAAQQIGQIAKAEESYAHRAVAALEGPLYVRRHHGV